MSENNVGNTNHDKINVLVRTVLTANGSLLLKLFIVNPNKQYPKRDLIFINRHKVFNKPAYRANYTDRPVPNVFVHCFPRLRFKLLKRTKKRFSAQLNTRSLSYHKQAPGYKNIFFVPTPAASQFYKIFEFTYSYHNCYIFAFKLSLFCSL